MSNTQSIVPVILCGGSGTRLWPASREQHPKQFLNLMGDFSLLQNTMRRSLRIVNAPAENLVTVTLGALAGGVEEQLNEIDPAASRHILSEPSARNTAAAVAYAALYVAREFGGDAMLWILPADHHIDNEDALGAAFRQGLEAAQQGSLVTFGIQPTRPDTGYGYINLGPVFIGDAVHRAAAFVEKPDLKTAQSYLDAGTYLWNSGMFLFRASDVIAQYETHAPEVLAAVEKAMAAGSAGAPDATLYNAIPDEPFDKAIMEKSADVAVVPCNPEWSDIGSWESLWDIREKDMHGNVTEGRVACHDTKNCLIQARGERLVACAGVENIVVVETEDAILVSDRSNADSMKVLVKGLKKSGAREVIEPPARPQPWSLNKTLPDSSGYTTREFSAQPGQKLLFKAHNLASLMLTAIEGCGVVAVRGEKKTVTGGRTVMVPDGFHYTVENTTREPLIFIEISKERREIAGAEEPADLKRSAA